ncbi:hypothetical protein Poli38472_008544 [Pythium oligandrum]|uniref:ENTH domain-containing protein n=1 Tax=Pythium oligandrum TaxID=41045 RepID=A0A8K1C3M0_PYTOL|nr:hypothetical protein Poli38472_008544 [Pythium oligandrum]|eukprot:TMW55896.1 hypothetical protein Poli38472_008544 [Pythium oligandrum]
MNRQTLTEATTLQDAPVPVYLMDQIAAGTKASERDAEKTADFLLGRLAKTNLIVKLKALQIIAYCIREGSPVFADVIREEESEISSYLQYSGPPDPTMGDERYRRIRVASQEALVCLNDGSLPRNDAPAPAASAPWGAQQSQSSGYDQQQQSQYGGNNAYGNTGNAPSYGQQSHEQNSSSQGGYNPQTWGSNANSNAQSSYGGASRPAPYSDNPSSTPSYGGPGGGYGGPQNQYGGSGGYGGSSYGQNDNNGSSQQGYGGGYNAPGQQQPPQQQASGFSSWSNPASGGAGGAPKGGAGGMWSSSGYQKPTPTQPHAHTPQYTRDNRPTVLVGHAVSFSRPQSYGNSSLVGGIGGPSGIGSNSNAFGGSSGYGNSSSGFGSHQGRNSNAPSYIENMNRMLNSSTTQNALSGMTSSMQTVMDQAAASKLGETVKNLKKVGVEVKDRWDTRNMDKSIGASLADHDELSAGPQVLDRGYFQPQSMGQAPARADTMGEYERGLIDNLCASVGLARAPPADALKRFVELAQTLDHQTIGDILLDKLEDPVWQVRLKALHVVLALLNSPGSGPYMEVFEDNAGVFEELRNDAKPTVASKSLQVLRALGLADESTPAPRRTAAARPTARAASNPQTHSAPANQEVDFLGLGALSINDAAPQPPAQQPHVAAPPAPEISLLDGFDTAPAPVHQHQQQQYYQQQQQYYQQQPQQPLSPSQQYTQAAPPPQQPQQEYGDLLSLSPVQQPQPAPSHVPGGFLDDRSKALSDFGKDLFTTANSPRTSTSSQQPVNERSAFDFM